MLVSYYGKVFLHDSRSCSVFPRAAVASLEAIFKVCALGRKRAVTQSCTDDGTNRLLSQEERHMMVYPLHDILQDLQAGRTAVSTVKPCLLKIEASAHPRGIHLRLHLLGEQGSSWRCEHIVPDLRAFCAACGIDEDAVVWHVTARNKEPRPWVPFLFF